VAMLKGQRHECRGKKPSFLQSLPSICCPQAGQAWWESSLHPQILFCQNITLGVVSGRRKFLKIFENQGWEHGRSTLKRT